jgi:hypothetical protein
MPAPELKEPMDKITFVSNYNNDRLKLDKFQASKYMIMAMIGLQSEGTQKE